MPELDPTTPTPDIEAAPSQDQIATEPDSPQDTEEAAQPTDDPRIKELRKEAAKYRKRAQEAEEARNKAIDLVDDVARAAVAGFLTEQRINPAFVLDTYDPLSFIIDGAFNYDAVLKAVSDQEEKQGVKVVECGPRRQPKFIGDPNTGMPGRPKNTGDWSAALRG